MTCVVDPGLGKAALADLGSPPPVYRSACLPAVFVCAQVFFCPESPRWLLGKQRHRKAWESLLKFRRTPLQAAVDLYYTCLLYTSPSPRDS